MQLSARGDEHFEREQTTSCTLTISDTYTTNSYLNQQSQHTQPTTPHPSQLPIQGNPTNVAHPTVCRAIRRQLGNSHRTTALYHSRCRVLSPCNGKGVGATPWFSPVEC